MIRALVRWWRDLTSPLPPSPHCRCRPCLAFRRPGENEDHPCAAGCLIHGPKCPDCGLYLVPPR